MDKIHLSLLDALFTPITVSILTNLLLDGIKWLSEQMR